MSTRNTGGEDNADTIDFGRRRGAGAVGGGLRRERRAGQQEQDARCRHGAGLAALHRAQRQLSRLRRGRRQGQLEGPRHRLLSRPRGGDLRHRGQAEDRAVELGATLSLDSVRRRRRHHQGDGLDHGPRYRARSAIQPALPVGRDADHGAQGTGPEGRARPRGRHRVRRGRHQHRAAGVQLPGRAQGQARVRHLREDRGAQERLFRQALRCLRRLGSKPGGDPIEGLQGRLRARYSAGRPGDGAGIGGDAPGRRRLGRYPQLAVFLADAGGTERHHFRERRCDEGQSAELDHRPPAGRHARDRQAPGIARQLGLRRDQDDGKLCRDLRSQPRQGFALQAGARHQRPLQHGGGALSVDPGLRLAPGRASVVPSIEARRDGVSGVGCRR